MPAAAPIEARRELALGVSGGRERRLGQHANEGGHRRLDAVYPLECGLGELDRRYLASADQLPGAGSVELEDFVAHHRASNTSGGLSSSTATALRLSSKGGRRRVRRRSPRSGQGRARYRPTRPEPPRPRARSSPPQLFTGADVGPGDDARVPLLESRARDDGRRRTLPRCSSSGSAASSRRSPGARRSTAASSPASIPVASPRPRRPPARAVHRRSRSCETASRPRRRSGEHAGVRWSGDPSPRLERHHRPSELRRDDRPRPGRAGRRSSAACMHCEGVRPDDVVVHGFGLGFFVGGLPLKDAIENIGATFVPIGMGASERLVKAIRDLRRPCSRARPRTRAISPSSPRACVRTRRELGLRRILLGAEPGGAIPAVRAAARGRRTARSSPRGWAMPTCSRSTRRICDEFDGNHLLAPTSASSSSTRTPVTSLEWEDGVEGELVATHLERECVPLVRFRVA